MEAAWRRDSTRLPRSRVAVVRWSRTTEPGASTESIREAENERREVRRREAGWLEACRRQEKKRERAAGGQCVEVREPIARASTPVSSLREMQPCSSIRYRDFEVHLASKRRCFSLCFTAAITSDRVSSSTLSSEHAAVAARKTEYQEAQREGCRRRLRGSENAA
jgi:hypothetical protein